jgi:hypothetical protein
MNITGQLKGEHKYIDGIKAFNYKIIIWSSSTESDHTIGTDILFDSDEPIVIDKSVDDIFTPIIKTTCTINLLTKVYLGDALYAANPTSIKCVVYDIDSKDVLFWGFVTPTSYDQDFNSTWNSISIQCIDALSILQYNNYYDNSFTQAVIKSKANGGFSTFEQIINRMITTITDCPVDLGLASTHAILYTSTPEYYTNLKLKINDVVFLGETDDDQKSNEDTLNSILKYLSLNVVVDSTNIIIFHRSIQTTSGAQYTYDLSTGTTASTTYTSPDSNPRMFEDTLAFSMDDIYNKLTINCDRDDYDDTFSSPLDSDSLDSPYPCRIKYMQEMISEGEGIKAIKAFKSMVKGEDWTFDDAKTKIWYTRFLTNTNWSLTYNGVDVSNIISTTLPPQQAYMEYLRSHSGVPCLLELANRDEKNSSGYINSPSLTKDNYLVFSINGNHDNTETRFPQAEDVTNFKVEYTNTASVNYTPTSPDTVNYIVFKGSMKYQPLMATTYIAPDDKYSTTFKQIHDNIDGITYIPADLKAADYVYYTALGSSRSPFWHHTVPSDNNKDGMYYAQKFYKSSAATDTTVDETNAVEDTLMLYPPIDTKDAYLYKYSYSSDWDSTDKLSKLSMLYCQMFVKNDTETKWLNEIYDGTTDENGRKISSYEWTTTESYFTLGVDPNIGDCIIGTEFDMANNISNSMNIDETGMAIPIKYTDKLSGELTFRIVGLVDSPYKDTHVKKHHTMFRHTTWETDNVYLLSWASALWIKNFECKIYTNGGGKSLLNDVDLSYTSDENTEFVRNYEDIDFDISTALTTDEAISMKVKNNIFVNLVYNSDNTPCLQSVSFDGTKDKAEKNYINYYYPLISTPTRVWSGDFEITGKAANLTSTPTDYLKMYEPISLYYSPNEKIGHYKLMPIENSFNLNTGIMTIKAREINSL